VGSPAICIHVHVYIAVKLHCTCTCSLVTRPQATYQRRTETLEKELQVSLAERENLQRLVEELKAQLRHTETASLPRGYKLSGAAGGQRYYSWQVTDIDDAIAQHKRSKSERTGLVNVQQDLPQTEEGACP